MDDLETPSATWFIKVGLRDAINTGRLVERPRIFTAGGIGDYEPSWAGTPEHTLGVPINNVSDMITEVRRQTKQGVDFIKLADST